MSTSFLRIRCFLEGYEIPIISASVTASMNDIARASVELIATPQALLIRPKTSILIFFLEEAVRPPNSSTSEVNNKYYKLFFSGEVHGISINKSAEGRVLTLTCTDHFENLSRAYTYYTEQQASVSNLINTKAYFAAAMIIQNSINQANFTLLEEVFKDPKPKSIGFTDAKGILAAMIRMIELYTGIIEQGTTGANAFFTHQQNRLKILEQITIASEDLAPLKIFKADVLANFVGNTYGRLGGLVKVIDVIQMILSIIGYVRCPNPLATTLTGGVEKEISLTQKAIDARTSFADGYRNNQTVNESLSSYFGTPEIARKISNAIDSADALRILKENNVINSKAYNYLSTTVKESDQLEFQVSIDDVRSVATELLNANESDPNRLPTDDSGINAVFSTMSNVSSTATRITSSKLNSTLMMPDFLYADPPKCNILFPCMYNMLSFNRQAADETSRLQMVTNLQELAPNAAGVDELTYFSPSFPFLNGLQGKKLSENLSVDELVNQQSDNGKSRVGLIMDHEMFTGVVPEFASMSRLAMLIDNGKNYSGETTEEGLNGKDDYFTRYADAMFIQRRLSQRSISASGPFNPYPVVGFPMLVIDQTSQGAETEQFIGVLQSITHSISQSGGSTSYSVIYARPVSLADDEFFKYMDKDLREALKPKWLESIYDVDKVGDVYWELIGSESMFVRGKDQNAVIADLQKEYDALRSEQQRNSFYLRMCRREICSMQFAKDVFFQKPLKEVDRLSTITQVCVGGASQNLANHTETVSYPKNEFEEKVDNQRVKAVIDYANSLQTRSLVK
jgi:hypothetical protein